MFGRVGDSTNVRLFRSKSVVKNKWVFSGDRGVLDRRLFMFYSCLVLLLDPDILQLTFYSRIPL